MGRRPEGQLKSQMCGSLERFSIRSFLQDLQVARNNNGIHKILAMRLLHIFKKKPAGAIFNSHMWQSSSGQARQKGELTSYCQSVNYLPATYKTDNSFGEDNMDKINFKQAAGQSEVEYVQSVLHESFTLRAPLRNIQSQGNFDLKTATVHPAKHSKRLS